MLPMWLSGGIFKTFKIKQTPSLSEKYNELKYPLLTCLLDFFKTIIAVQTYCAAVYPLVKCILFKREDTHVFKMTV